MLCASKGGATQNVEEDGDTTSRSVESEEDAISSNELEDGFTDDNATIARFLRSVLIEGDKTVYDRAWQKKHYADNLLNCNNDIGWYLAATTEDGGNCSISRCNVFQR